MNLATTLVKIRQTRRKKSLATKAYEALRREILDNRLAPGFVASETMLAQMLNMSRTPVREALVLLEREGLIAIVPRHGIQVLSISAEQYCEIYQVITALEIMAIQILAERNPNAKEVAGLQEQIDRMKHALSRDDLESWASADERFHKELVTLSRNKLLAKIVATYTDQAHRARVITLPLRQVPRQSTENHAQVVEAIARGDVEAAMTIHRQQRTRSSRELIKIIRQFNISRL